MIKIRNKKEFRLLWTPIVSVGYCLLWIVLEWAVCGEVVNSTVDNIMMAMFVPTIWMSMGAVYDDLRLRNSDKENQENKDKINAPC